jgi:hypothetical protein
MKFHPEQTIAEMKQHFLNGGFVVITERPGLTDS